MLYYAMTSHTQAPGQLLAVLTEARDWIQHERCELFECCTDENGRYADDEDAAHVAVIDELLARINAAIEAAT